MLVPLTGGNWTAVSCEDYPRVILYRWYQSESNDGRFYARSDAGYLHRFIMGVTDTKSIVDHINGDTMDNTRPNLRVCTQAQNLKNTKKTTKKTSSKHKGVSWIKSRERWQCRLVFEGKAYQSYHKDELEAAKAYNELAKQYFGEYAKLNIIEEEQ